MGADKPTWAELFGLGGSVLRGKNIGHRRSVHIHAPIGLVTVGVLFVATIFALLGSFKWLPPPYFKAWSASGDVKFFDGVKVDTPVKFLWSASIVFANTFVQQIVVQTMGNYITNGVADYKAPRSDLIGSDTHIHITLQAFNIYNTLATAVRIFFLFSNFFYVLTQCLAGIVVTYIVTSLRLSQKPQTHEDLQGLCNDAVVHPRSTKCRNIVRL